jgi:hypothetical protein
MDAVTGTASDGGGGAVAAASLTGVRSNRVEGGWGERGGRLD